MQEEYFLADLVVDRERLFGKQSQPLPDDSLHHVWWPLDWFKDTKHFGGD